MYIIVRSYMPPRPNLTGVLVHVFKLCDIWEMWGKIQITVITTIMMESCHLAGSGFDMPGQQTMLHCYRKSRVV